MKPRHEKKAQPRRTEALKNPRRETECEASLSRELPRGKDEPAGPRGACAPETTVQGSE
jgi:hypothetical protein